MKHTHRFRVWGIAVVAAALSGLMPTTTVAETPYPTQLGVAEADITYRIGAGQGGFGERWRVNHLESQPIETNMYARLMKSSEGVHMNLRVKAFVFDNGEKKLAFLSGDLLGIVQMFHRGVAREIESDPGIAWDDLMLVGTHTESAPSNGTMSPLLSAYAGVFDEDFARIVFEKSVQAIRDAARDLEPVAFAAGTTEVDAAGNFVFDETEPPFVDRGLDVLRFDRLDGTTKAVIVAYPGHFTIAGNESRLLSSDGAGYVERLLEDRLESRSGQKGRDVLVGYVPGTVGDSGVRGPSEENIYQSTEGRARILVNAATEVIDGLVPETGFVVDSVAERFPPPPGHEVPNFPLLAGAPIPFMVSHSLHAQVFRIGDSIFAGVPGEPVTELGLALRKNLKDLGFEHPVPLSHANDWTGYIYTDEQYDQQQGRSDQGAYGRNQGWYLVRKLTDLAKKQMNPDYDLGDFDRSALMRSDDLVNTLSSWTIVTATPVTHEVRDAALVPNVVLECSGLVDATDVSRFDRTAFAWRGGNNGADLPTVELQRLADDADPQEDGSWQTVTDAEGPDLHLWLQLYQLRPTDPVVPGEPGCNELLDQIYSVVFEPLFDLPAGTYRFVATGVFRTAPKTDEAYRAVSSSFDVSPGVIDAAIELDGDDVLVRLVYPEDPDGIRWRPRATPGGTAQVLLDGSPVGTATFGENHQALVLADLAPSSGQVVSVPSGGAEDPWGNTTADEVTFTVP